jgi:hypothetical protein
MPSPFARLLDFAESAQFRKDSSGRMVFLPLISKGQGFFVDSLSDEEKLRALVRLYRGANVLLGLLWSLLNYLAVLAPGSISSYYRGEVPLHAKLTAVAWVASISLVFYGVADGAAGICTNKPFRVSRTPSPKSAPKPSANCLRSPSVPSARYSCLPVRRCC